MSERLQEVTGDRVRPRGSWDWLAGRTGRKQYWVWIGPTLVVGLMLTPFFPPAAYAMSLLVTAVWIRRFHDLGRTGWWAPAINIAVNVLTFAAAQTMGEQGVLVGGVLYFGGIIGLGVVPGQPHENEFGPPPGRKSAVDVADTFS